MEYYIVGIFHIRDITQIKVFVKKSCIFLDLALFITKVFYYVFVDLFLEEYLNSVVEIIGPLRLGKGGDYNFDSVGAQVNLGLKTLLG